MNTETGLSYYHQSSCSYWPLRSSLLNVLRDKIHNPSSVLVTQINRWISSKVFLVPNSLFMFPSLHSPRRNFTLKALQLWNISTRSDYLRLPKPRINFSWTSKCIFFREWGLWSSSTITSIWGVFSPVSMSRRDLNIVSVRFKTAPWEDVQTWHLLLHRLLR